MTTMTPDGKTQSDLCKSFNKSIKQLAKKLYIISKKSIKVSSLMNQLKMATSESPILLIEGAGPDIYKHREIIQNKDKDFFDKVDFTAVYGHTDKLKANMDLFNMVKEKWPKLAADEQQTIGGIVANLLDCYIKYTLFEKIKSGKMTVEQAGFIEE